MILIALESCDDCARIDVAWRSNEARSSLTAYGVIEFSWPSKNHRATSA